MLHQATGVAIRGHAILLEGPPGSGKSTLALQLLDRGAQLVGDDGVTLSVAGGRLVASPPPNIAGLIEARNVGLMQMPATEAPVALVLRLSAKAPRFVEQAEAEERLGIPVPLLLFDPSIPAAAIRAELALAHHGLRFDLPTSADQAHT